VVIPHLGTFGEVGERDILERAGCEVVVLSSRDEDAAIAACGDADGVIAPPHLSHRFIASLERCQVIACSSMGMDGIHGVDLATQKGILLCHVPDVFADEVATHTITLLLAAARWLVPVAAWVRAGNWGRPGSARPGGYMHRVTGETLGIIALGNVGRRVARKARGLEMEVLAYDPYAPPEVFAASGARAAPLAQVLQDSDFVCLLAPLTAQTRGLLAAPQLRLMKREAILVNTARGELVDEPALIEALRTGRILGAALDVVAQEPIAPHNPLLALPNVIVTPHMASVSTWASVERRRRPAQEVAAVLTGHRPRAIWNPAALERRSLR
jgi:D-3-phosphoglycerate dehydrogenase